MKLYTYFRSKSDLLDAVAVRILEDLDTDFEPALPWEERVRRGTFAWAGLQARHRRAFPLVYRGVMGLGLNGCRFQNVRFEFEGPAANTLAVLQAMTAPNSGLREVVKRSFPILFAH